MIWIFVKLRCICTEVHAPKGSVFAHISHSIVGRCVFFFAPRLANRRLFFHCILIMIEYGFVHIWLRLHFNIFTSLCMLLTCNRGHSNPANRLKKNISILLFKLWTRRKHNRKKKKSTMQLQLGCAPESISGQIEYELSLCNVNKVQNANILLLPWARSMNGNHSIEMRKNRWHRTVA